MLHWGNYENAILRDKYKPLLQIPSTVKMNCLHHNIYLTNNKGKIENTVKTWIKCHIDKETTQNDQIQLFIGITIPRNHIVLLCFGKITILFWLKKLIKEIPYLFQNQNRSKKQEWKSKTDSLCVWKEFGKVLGPWKAPRKTGWGHISSLTQTTC